VAFAIGLVLATPWPGPLHDAVAALGAGDERLLLLKRPETVRLVAAIADDGGSVLDAEREVFDEPAHEDGRPPVEEGEGHWLLSVVVVGRGMLICALLSSSSRSSS